jgi:hypothetical protein
MDIDQEQSLIILALVEGIYTASMRVFQRPSLVKTSHSFIIQAIAIRIYYYDSLSSLQSNGSMIN